MTSAREDQTPLKVTQREIAELLRTFARSGWRSMRLEIGGLRLAVGKDAPPPPDPVQPAPAASVVAAPAETAAPPAAEVPSEVSAPRRAAVPGSSAQPAATQPPPAELAAQPVDDTTGLVEVRSPTVGTFWVAPRPGAPPFVQVGQSVKAGDQLAIVEVMKLMNPVVAPQAGEVVRVCAANAELVEFDQVLFLLRPSDG